MRQFLSLDPARTALLLIDLQEEQRTDPLYAVSGFANVLANAARLLAKARSQHLAIFHAAYRRDFGRCPPRPFEPLATDGTATFSDKNNPLTAICAEVAPIAGETVIEKNDASAFGEGGLHAALTQAGTEWLAIAGVWTEACVAATVRDAMAAGLRVLLVKDACGSGTAAMHMTAILNLANRLYGGAVADTDTALRLIGGEKADVWACERPVPILFDFATAESLYAQL